VFHVSQLKKCLRVPDRTIDVVDVTLEPDLTYLEHPIRILDQKDRITQKRTLKFCKVQWNQHNEDEATWETQDFLENHFPRFLASCWGPSASEGPQKQDLIVFLEYNV
jgi:hypothetical protein